MFTCKDCVHYNVCGYHIDEETFMTTEECSHFKNKADFVEVKHGEWAWYPDRMDRQELLCTNCEETAPYNEDGERMRTSYCPNCGAEMRKEGADNG